MEKFNNEVVDLIIDSFRDDKQLIVNILFYLYKTTTDDAMKQSILHFMNEQNICIQCGSEMVYYEWNEPRPLGSETMSAYDCPCCGDLKYKEGVRRC